MMTTISVEKSRNIIRELIIGALAGLVWLVIIGWSLTFRGAWGWLISIPISLITAGFMLWVLGGGLPDGEWKRTGLGVPYFEFHSTNPSLGEIVAAVVIIVGVVSGIIEMIIH